MRITCHGLKPEDFTVEFINHEASLGYTDSNLIPIKVEGVSRHHAVLIEDGNSLFIEDNGSLNGTYLNGRAVHSRQRIFSGDLIQISFLQIMVEILIDGTVFLDFISHVPENGIAVPPNEKMQKDAVGKKTGSASESSSSKPQSPAVSRSDELFTEGREIGKYILGKRIGKGGMGEIYLAKHKTLGIYRALKVLPKDIREENAEFFERFLREAKLASEIRHHNVVSVMDVETDSSSGFPYIVMEYVDGGSLRNTLNSSKKLSEEQAIVIVEAVASALQAAEAHKIVHRDIKPDNIMFTQQGEVKLADLGIAKNGELDNDLTRTNMIIGTPAYLPPEQAQNAKHVDCRADIYSLGATFYEMLTGETPYPGSNPYEIIHKLIAAPVPDPRDINPEVSDASAALVMKMLAKDPKNRFQNAAELLEYMNRTFPPRTSYESAELVKKVLAGECENSAAFSSKIEVSQPESWIRRFSKWVALFFIGFCCFFSAFYFCTNIRSFAARSSSAPQAGNEEKPVDDGAEVEVVAVDETLPVETAVVQNDSHELKIKTKVAGAKILISGGGLKKEEEYYSDENGNCKIERLPSGRYKVEISKDEYLTHKEDLELERDVELSVLLPAVTYKLAITALPGSKVSISGEKNDIKEGFVPSSGQLEISDLVKDTIHVQVDLPDWEPVDTGGFALNGDQDLDVSVLQQTSLTVTTVPGAEVVLKGRKTEERSATAIRGTAVFKRLRADQYEVSVSCTGYRSGESSFDPLQSKERELRIGLEKIETTYDLTIKTEPNAQIQLLLDEEPVGTSHLTLDGNLNLSDLRPGKYSIFVEKQGKKSKKFEHDLKKDDEIECFLPDGDPVAVGASGPEKTNAAQDSGQTAAADPGKENATAQDTQQNLPPEKKKHTVTFLCSGSQLLTRFINGNGARIKIGDRSWSPINRFPWKEDLEEGEYHILMRSEGIQDFSASITVGPDKENNFYYLPEPKPATLVFQSNQSDASINYNGKNYKPGDEVECDLFQKISATGAYGGKSNEQTINGLKPDERKELYFYFSENDSNSSVREKYLEGKDLFEKWRYDEALEVLLPIADEHRDAATLVAKIYDLKRNVLQKITGSHSKDALDWYKKAADLGDPESALVMADAIYDGEYKESAELMVRYYLTAAKLPDRADLYYKVSNFYKDGRKGVRKDDAKAVAYLKIAAEKGLTDAMYDLGIRYDKGNGVPSNSQECLKWINKAADAGHSRAKSFRAKLKKK